MRQAGQWMVILLSLGVTGYALVAYAAFPLGATMHPEIRESFESHRWAVYLHVFASALALALGPFQFLAGLRARRPRLHRWMGRAYLAIGVGLGGAAGLYLAFHAAGGAVARLGFGGLALAWLATGALAYRAIREGDVQRHRRWMVRNFALTFAAVTLRLWLPGSLAFGWRYGLRFEMVYPVIAWLCWVPNLLVAQWLLQRRAAGPGAGSLEAARG